MAAAADPACRGATFTVPVRADRHRGVVVTGRFRGGVDARYSVRLQRMVEGSEGCIYSVARRWCIVALEEILSRHDGNGINDFQIAFAVIFVIVTAYAAGRVHSGTGTRSNGIWPIARATNQASRTLFHLAVRSAPAEAAGAGFCC
jgi:hypothetical protein